MLQFSRPVRSLRTRFLGCSLAALAAGIGGAAYADCLPDPLVANGSTVCSGITTGGLTAGVPNSVTLSSGATLSAAIGGDAAFTVTSTDPSSYTTYIALNADGHVDGGASAGVLVEAGVSSSTLNLTVGSGGVIDGATAIRLRPTAGNTYGRASLYLDNAGTITASAGPAIVGDNALVGLSSLTNRASGNIGGINAAVQTLTNAGVIDGGTGSAYAFSTNASFQTITNTGTMRSTGTAATIAAPVSFLTVTNSGLIRNGGAGPALATTNGTLTLENKAGGVIESQGSVAIKANGLSLINRGTINGSVTSDWSNSGFYYTVDTANGVINGDLLLGAANDTVITTYDPIAHKLASVTGRIDGGGGVNTLQVNFNTSSTLDDLFQNVALPASFTKFGVALSNDAVLTLNGDAPDGLVVTGTGRLVSTGAVTGYDPAFLVGDYPSSGLTFQNTGAITVTAWSGSAVAIYGQAKGVNDGTITAGLGEGVRSTSSGDFINNGTITGASTGFYGFTSALVNNGLVKSTSNLGAYLLSSTSTNNGTILGRTNGVEAASNLTLINNGAITGEMYDGVTVSSYATIDNRSAGVITGTKSAIRRSETYGFYVNIINAGVLNGDVDLRASGFTTSDNYTDMGGTLNGSLLFSNGADTLTADLARFENGKLAGVSGVVDGGGGIDTLVLRVKSDATTTVVLPVNFEALSFDLSNNASIKATVSTPLTGPLKATGAGHLDVTASGATSSTTDNTVLFQLTAPLPASTETLSAISRGAFTLNLSGAGYGSIVKLGERTSFENSGSLTVNQAVGGYASYAIQGGGAVKNTGVIVVHEASGVGGAASFTNTGSLTGDGASISVVGVHVIDNSGAIASQGQAINDTAYTYVGYYDPPATATITNSGRISSSGATTIAVDYRALTLKNLAGGVISSTTGEAIHAGQADDRIENYGQIVGDVSLGAGNDTFVQWVGGKMTGTVDGGLGLDTLIIDSTGGGSITGAQFVSFESFKQIGGGNLVYEGSFAGGVTLDGGGASVLVGTTVTTPAFIGLGGSEQVANAGSIIGGVYLGDGVDSVENRGSITGDVRLGDGDDTYVEGAGASVTGAVDGGAGADTYIAELAGDRSGLQARTGFERLGVTGTGKLTLTLDQNWQSLALAGTSIDLTLDAFDLGAITGGDGGEAVVLDRDIASVGLGGGADSLTAAGNHVTGDYEGGAGADRLTFTTHGTVLIEGAVSGFETIALTGGQMDVSGALGAQGEMAAFGDGDQTLSILNGGTLAGTVDLGAGKDVFRLAAGGHLIGTVLGGADVDLVSIDLTSDLSLGGDQLQQFETLEVTGTGKLTFSGGAARFDKLVTSSDELIVGAGASLNTAVQLSNAANTAIIGGTFTGALDMGGGDDVLRLTAGSVFSGSAAGGTGDDRLELALGGTDTAPVALGSTAFTGFETLSLQSGVASLAGGFGFDRVEVSNGRLIGLAGSVLTANDIFVARGATFGSAGAVIGDIVVAGTLSPGASPGTMTVTGDLSLAAGSTSLFELTPTVSDKLVVSGVVTIAPGSTLKLVGERPLVPGQSLDLIVASGGIVGGYSTIDGAQALNIHLKQSANRLRALGLLSTDTAFSAPVSNVIGLLNTALIDETASPALATAMASLADAATGKSNPAALSKLPPQAYASASQIGVEDGLAVIDATREQARFAPETLGLFGFGQALTTRRTLDGDADGGVFKGKMVRTGGFSGVGYGTKDGWVGAFVGYLDGSQRIVDLDVRTNAKSYVFGVQAQANLQAFDLGLTVAHDQADAQTRRTLAGGVTAGGDYKIKSWIGDIHLAYTAVLNADWQVRPRLGASYVRSSRDGVSEQGSNPFVLDVEGGKTNGGFVDGQVEFLGGQSAARRFHPYVSGGFRTRISGGDASAVANWSALGTSIRAEGLDRDATTALVGAGFNYDLSRGLTVSATYSGEYGDGGRQAAIAGLRWAF
jgi:fibronectin-binding autotransporter adhesin